MTGYETQPLEELVVEVRTGSTPSTSRPDFFNGDIDWFTPGDVGQQKCLQKAARRITRTALAEGHVKLFPAGSLLITCIGQIGRVGILDRPASSNQQITSLRFSDRIDRDFSYYWFVAHQSDLERHANMAVLPILNNERLLSIRVTYPTDISEQKRIAYRLDRADELRRMSRYALQMCDEFIPAAFLDMFGDPGTNPKQWDQELIDDALEFSQYGTSQKSTSDSRGYPILGMANITDDGRITLPLAYVDLTNDAFESLKLHSGDIIFNRTNSTELVGKTACWTRNMDAVIASYLVRLRLKPHMLPEFFSALLNTKHFKVLFQERCKKAVGQSNISPTLLREFRVYVPPLELQRQFANLVAQHEQLRATHIEALRQTDHLFQTLLHQAFNA